MLHPLFYLVDVFAEEKYAGNQLAVFRHTASLDDHTMQTLAREINFSETTFIASDDEKRGGYDVRIFTPKHELPFAGHPTLGTAFIIQQQIVRRPVESLTLNLKIGPIPVTFTYADGKPEYLWMRQIPPTFGPIHPILDFCDILNLQPEDFDDRFPIEEVSTGMAEFIVPLKSMDAIKRAAVKLDRLYPYINKTEAKGILVFCPETHHGQNQLKVRFFAHYHGVPEDPATGSANGCLAAYLVKHKYFGQPKIDVRVEQGHEIGRPSLLLLRACPENNTITVNVGGRVILVAQGELSH